jgi:hypothetical protein
MVVLTTSLKIFTFLTDFFQLKAHGFNRGMKNGVARNPKKGVARATNIFYIGTHDR